MLSYLVKSKIFNQVFVALVANVGGLMFGIMLGWSAPVSETIIGNVHYPFITSVQFGWIVAMMPLGGICSCILPGMLRKLIGTKFTFFVFGFPIVIGYLLMIVAYNLNMLMVGRFFIGISAGCYAYLLPIYIGELASNEIRGTIGSLFQVMVNTGILFVFILGYFANYFVLNVVCGVIPIVYSVAFLFLPETPAMLVNKNHNDDAIAVMKFFRGKNFDYKKEIDDLVKQKQQQTTNFKQIFSVKATRKAFIIMMILFLFFQMSGINVIIFYSTMIFTEAGVTVEPGISSIIVAAVQVIATLFATAFVDQIGRKILLVSSTAIMCASMLGISIYFLLQEMGYSVDGITWLALISFSLFVIAFCFGMAPVTYIILGEIFTQDAKPYIAPVCQMFSFLLMLILGIFFPLLVDVIAFGYTFLIFAIFNFVGTIFVIFMVPETKGKSFGEIQDILN